MPARDVLAWGETTRRAAAEGALLPRGRQRPVRAADTGTRFAAAIHRGSLTSSSEGDMAERQATKAAGDGAVTRERLIELLNEDLSREYQAVIAYVVYSQVLKGAQYMAIAAELEKHAAEELAHALVIAKQIDYLGGMPTVTPKAVKTSEKPEEMLRFDLDNENETVRNYKERVRQCESLGEFAMAEHIRAILVQEQEHQIDLATALGKDVSEVTAPEERA
jgi:bacterioferritin